MPEMPIINVGNLPKNFTNMPAIDIIKILTTFRLPGSSARRLTKVPKPGEIESYFAFLRAVDAVRTPLQLEELKATIQEMADVLSSHNNAVMFIIEGMNLNTYSVTAIWKNGANVIMEPTIDVDILKLKTWAELRTVQAKGLIEENPGAIAQFKIFSTDSLTASVIGSIAGAFANAFNLASGLCC